VLLTFIAAISGVIGARTHLSSYMLARIAFGTQGAALVNIAFAVSLLGWFGVNIDLFSGAIGLLISDTADVDLNPWIVELAAGAAMTFTTLYGFRAINFLSLILVPAMMLVTVVTVSEAFTERSLADTLAALQESEITFGYAVSTVVGGVIIGAVILPDITRFIRKPRGAVYTAILSYLVVQTTVMLAGGVAADTFANADLLDVWILIGLGWGAFTIVIAGSWILNTLNLYSTALSTEATFPGANSRWLVLGLGALGTLAAFLNILDSFLTFLFYLAIVFVPVAGVIAVDHFFVRPSAYSGAALLNGQRRSGPALLAWLAGSVVALLGAESVIVLSGVAALDALFVSSACYLAFTHLGRAHASSDTGSGDPRC